MSSKLDEALALLAAAEEDVDLAMKSLGSPSGGADKTMIAKVLEDAFEKLRIARRDLADLKQVIKEP